MTNGPHPDFSDPEAVRASIIEAGAVLPPDDERHVRPSLDASPPSLADILADASEAAKAQKKSSCRDRISAVASGQAQANLQARFAAALLSAEDAMTYKSLLAWIDSMLAACRALPDELSPDYPELFDHVDERNPTDNDGEDGDTWLNTVTGAMFRRHDELAGPIDPAWRADEHIMVNSDLLRSDHFWPVVPDGVANLTKRY